MTRTSLVLLLVLGAACQSGGSNGYLVQPPPPPPPPGGGNPPPTSAQVAMNSSDDGYSEAVHRFNPGSVRVARNGTVTWSNETGFVHNVTFTARAGVPNNVSDFGAGQAVRTFAVAGTFPYRCTNHPGMDGEVIVP